jgi:hypothetical protein
MRIISFVAAAFVAMPFAARAQTADTLSLLGRNTLTLGFGLTGNSSSSVTIDGTATHSSGQVGSMAFSHWLRPTVAFQASAEVLGADASAGPGIAHNNTLTPILFGFSVSPRSFAISRTVRPYLSAAVGPYIHTVSDVQGTSTSSTVESSAGARFGVGANWFVARHFLVGIDGNYHAVHRFDHPDALTKDPSGFGMSFVVGFAWGGK